MHNNYTVIFLFLLRFFSILLLWSFFRLKELFQVKNDSTTSFLFSFFFDNAKNLGRSEDAKRRKKKDGLMHRRIFRAEIQYFDTAFFKDFASRCYGDVMNKNGMILGFSNLLIVTIDVVFKHS